MFQLTFFLQAIEFFQGATCLHQYGYQMTEAGLTLTQQALLGLPAFEVYDVMLKHFSSHAE